MPRLNAYESWVVETAEDIGLSHAGNPVPYSEISAWSREMGLSLSAWEFETLKKLSGAYVSEVRATKDDKNRAPPFITEAGRKALALAHAKRRKATMLRIGNNNG